VVKNLIDSPGLSLFDQIFNFIIKFVHVTLVKSGISGGMLF